MVNKGLFRKILNSLVYLLGAFLIFGGLAVLIWIARPYFALWFSRSERIALEKAVQSGRIKDNRIIIPSILVDALILEGKGPRQLSRGAAHIEGSPPPNSGGNFILEGHNLAEFGLFTPRSYFSLLDVIRKNAKIYVFWNGKKYVYRVKRKKVMDVTDPKLYQGSSSERITLITCVSTWSPTIYTKKRTVVIGEPLF